MWYSLQCQHYIIFFALFALCNIILFGMIGILCPYWYFLHLENSFPCLHYLHSVKLLQRRIKSFTEMLHALLLIWWFSCQLFHLFHLDWSLFKRCTVFSVSSRIFLCLLVYSCASCGIVLCFFCFCIIVYFCIPLYSCAFLWSAI